MNGFSNLAGATSSFVISNNNGTFNFIHNHSYFQGSSIIGNGTNALLSNINGDLIINSDYSLGECSPTVGMGNNALVFSETDYLGNPREYGTVDIGAFETSLVCGGGPPLRQIEAAKEFLVYPNPVSEKITIKSETEHLQIYIYDFAGKELIQSYEKEIDMSDLPSGLSILRAMDKGAWIHTEKLMKN